jgi:hypothetical protein
MGVYSQPRSSARRMQRRGELRHGAVAARFGQYLTLARGERVLSLAQGKAGKAATTTAIWSREGSEAAKSTTGTPTQRIPKIEAAHCQRCCDRLSWPEAVGSHALADQRRAS